MNKKENSSIRILIADDNESSRILLEDLLQQSGYDIRSAADGIEAVRIIENEEIDLVLTDLKMPGVDGMEVLRKAIRIQPDILVVIITGYASIDTAIESIREGAFDYIKKPFGLKEILACVNKASQRIRLTKENRLLFEKLQSTQQEIKNIQAKKEKLENKLNNLNENIESFQGELTSRIRTRKEIPFNFLPYKHPNEKNTDKDEVINDLDKLRLLMKNGMLNDDEFRTLKKRLLSMF